MITKHEYHRFTTIPIHRRLVYVIFILLVVSVTYRYGPHKVRTVKQHSPAIVPEEIFSSNYVNRPLKSNRRRPIRKTDGHRLILWWNQPGWMVGGRWNTDCNLSLCEYPNCRFTANKAYRNLSDAIVVSIVDGGYPRAASELRTNKDQALVFYTLEAPTSFWIRQFGMASWKNVFNWSMTYHRDADVFIPYGWLGRKNNPSDKKYSEIFRNKTKQALWIVSHCSTSSRREEYIKTLQKYINIDVFGSCGKGRLLQDDSFNELLSQYKFYLGFENALCRDYVTEKYFYYIKHDLITVVRGSADYNRLLPPKTFINTANFSSIESLGRFLSRLANDEEEYIKYLKEMNKYTVLKRKETYCDGLCSICEKLNNLEENRRTYDNIFDWTGTCQKPTDLK